MENVLLVADEDYLPTLMNLLDHAKKSVDIIAFSFAISSSNGRPAKTGAPYEIAAKLIELKEKFGAKMKIRLYIEGRRETADRNRLTAEFLKKAGVKVKYGSTHAKGFCIDGRYVLFGSTNLTNQSILKNNETNLFFDEPAVTDGFQEYFEHLWKGGKHGGVELELPMIADGGFEPVLIDLIDRSKKTIDFSIYFFHHTAIEKALIRAGKRGVKIHGFIHNHAMFAMSYVRRTRGTVERLREGGLKDLHYGPTHLFTHSKFLIRDRTEILLGTGNWLHEDVEVHPQLYVLFENTKLAKAMAKHLASKFTK